MPIALPDEIPKARRDVAARIYRAAMKQARYLLGTVHAWEGDASRRLLTGSRSGEHWIRPNTSAVEGFAFLNRFGPCDPAVVGVSRDRLLRETIVPMIRYLVETHATGRRPTGDGKRWGDAWQSAHWAYSLGRAAWFAGDDLPAALRIGVARVVAHEAGRFTGKKPPARIAGDTKAEENAWNSQIFSAAAVLMPRDPRRDTWEREFQRWAMSAMLRPADRDAATLVDGRPVAAQFTGANIHDDFTLENHGIVHPDYMTTFSLSMACSLDFLMTGRRPPGAVSYNAAGIYENLKWLSLPDGGFVYPNGQDWRLFRNPDWLYVHLLMAVLQRDPDAWSHAMRCLETLEKMQARSDKGAVYAPGEYFFASTQHSILRALTRLWILLHFGGDIPDAPTARRGVRRLDAGRLCLNRAAGAIHTLSWGRRIMVQCVPLRPDRIVSPHGRNGVGSIRKAGGRKDLPLRLRKIDLDDGPERFRAVLTVDHGDAVRARIAVVSAADGSLLISERLAALRSVTLDRVATGLVGVLNNPGWVYETGRRSIAVDGRTETVPAGSGHAHDFPAVRRLAIDGVLDIRSPRPLSARYEGAKTASRARHTDRLYLNWIRGPKTWKKGEEISSWEATFSVAQRAGAGCPGRPPPNNPEIVFDVPGSRHHFFTVLTDREFETFLEHHRRSVVAQHSGNVLHRRVGI